MKVTECAEISEAMKKTSYVAQEAGSSFDDLLVYITTISEKTRIEPESIGTGLRSVYSRYMNLKLGNMDDEGKSINDVEKALKRVNIEVRNAEGNFRDFDDVLKEFMTIANSGQMYKMDKLAGIQALGGNVAPYVEKSA